MLDTNKRNQNEGYVCLPFRILGTKLNIRKLTPTVGTQNEAAEAIIGNLVRRSSEQKTVTVY